MYIKVPKKYHIIDLTDISLFLVVSNGDPDNASEGEYKFVLEVLERKSPVDTDSKHNSLRSSSNETNSSIPREDSFIEEHEEGHTETQSSDQDQANTEDNKHHRSQIQR